MQARELDDAVAGAEVLDLSGLNCPLPILKTKAALARLAPGALLEVIVSHPDSQREFAVLGDGGGVRLLSARQEGGRYRYLLEKRA